jgi:hypothetical protein
MVNLRRTNLILKNNIRSSITFRDEFHQKFIINREDFFFILLEMKKLFENCKISCIKGFPCLLYNQKPLYYKEKEEKLEKYFEYRKKRQNKKN